MEMRVRYMILNKNLYIFILFIFFTFFFIFFLYKHFFLNIDYERKYFNNMLLAIEFNDIKSAKYFAKKVVNIKNKSDFYYFSVFFLQNLNCDFILDKCFFLKIRSKK